MKKIAEADMCRPKKPSSGFLFFSVENAEKIMKENPEIKMCDVSKMNGEKWKTVTEEEKKVYAEKVAIDR